MDEAAIKLECLKLSHTGSPDMSIKIAQAYYEWITEKPSEPPKRMGRPPKNKD